MLVFSQGKSPRGMFDVAWGALVQLGGEFPMEELLGSFKHFKYKILYIFLLKTFEQ